MITTAWGYTLRDLEELDPLLSLTEFDAMTAYKYSNDVRLPSLIKATSAAVRNYCGWHIAPAAACLLNERLYAGNGRIKQVDTDLLIQLPATFVSDVTGIYIDGGEVSTFAVETNGLLRAFNVGKLIDTKAPIIVVYNAGRDEGFDDVKELVANRVVHALSNSAGVSNETAGGVSVSYSSAWINGGGASAISDLDAGILTPYKLEGMY